MPDTADSSGFGLWAFAFLIVMLGGATGLILYLRRNVTRLQQMNLAFVKEKKAVYAFLRQIGKMMSAEIDLDGTLQAIVSFLVETTRAQAGAMFLVDENRKSLRARVLVGLFPPLHETIDHALTKIRFLHERMKRDPLAVGEGIIGEVAATAQPLLLSNAREHPRVPQRPGLEIETLIAAPLIVQDRVEGVFALVNRAGGAAFTEEDLSMLRALAEQASVTIQLVKMYDAMAEQKRIEQELRVAQDFQRMLLPEQCPQIPGVSIAAASVPAREVGGDFYDFFWLGGDRLGIVIADVAGKGIPGALIMSMVRSVVRAESPHATSPRAVLERVNQTIFTDTRENVFITMIFAILDLSRHTLTFARAGHEPLVAYSRADDAMRLLAPEGIALGLVEDQTFAVIRDEELPVRDGDVVVVYTDGMIEAMDRRGNEYGQERFLEALRTHADAPAEELVNSLVADIRRFAQGQQQSDDVTLVVLKFNRLASHAESVDNRTAGAAAAGPGGNP